MWCDALLHTSHFISQLIIIIARPFLVLCAGESISMNGFVPGAQEQEEEKEEDFSNISSVDVFSLAPFPSRKQDIFLQAPFGPRKNVPVLQQAITANFTTSSVGQEPITAHCVGPHPITRHHAVSAVKQQPIKVPSVTSNVRQQPIPAHHVLTSVKQQSVAGQHVLSSVGQQPITAHRVVSSVGQQAAVGSVSVGPLYSWTLDVRTSFQPRCHQEKP